MKKIEIFDIDGCICESFFPNLNKKANIKELKENILTTTLDPNFIKYFKISSRNSGRSFFVTGRRSKDFQDETIKQLKILNVKKEQIIFFPDNYSHTKIRYNNFKIFHILAIATKNKHSEIIVYDDLDEYVPKLLDFALILNIKNIEVKKVLNLEQFWKIKVREVNKI